MYAKILIGEACLPDAQKSIKPIDLGGVAGGTKYVVQDILFKYVII
jgi:hypothetical protein